MNLDETGSPARSDDGVSSALDVIVFSKDRACQLDALLSSMRNFLDYPHRIHVLYTTSSLEYERGYDLLRRWHTGLDWIGEHGQFGQAMKNLVARIHHGPGRFLMFLADDMMFIRQFSAQKLMESLGDEKDILAVSLQLGQKTIATRKDSTDITTGEISQEIDGGLRWAWKSGGSGYRDTPMSLDAQIFRLKDFAALMPHTRFTNPHEFATVLSERPFPRPDRVCEHQPSVINITASHVILLPGARRENISKEYLQKSFMRGLAIDTMLFANNVYNSGQIDEDIPLIEDERPRKLPEIEIIQKNGQPYYRVDLRSIPTFVINCDDNVDYRVFQQEQLSDLGFNFEFIRGLRVKPGWVGVALGHLKTLRLSRAQVPFLVLEDDCTFVDGFNPVLEIPIEAEAYYLGVSTFGLQTPGTISWGKHNATQWQRFDATNLRVFNMLARHAVLYLDDEFCKEVIESQVEALTNRNFPHPGDMGLARLHASHVILTPERNVCRQSDSTLTHVSLPDALPGNEHPIGDADEKFTIPKTSVEKSTVLNKPVMTGPGLCVISHKYRFIYFLIPKNASSSLRTELNRACYQSREIPVSQLDEDLIKNYFKFTFLRDPVSRLTSAYQEISIRNQMNDFTVKKKKFMEMDDGFARFEAFVACVLPDVWNPHIRSQSAFIAGEKMDFYGRVETLQNDLESVFKKLDIEPCPVLPRRRSREGRKNNHNYMRFNIDHTRLPDEMVRKIRRIYQEDVDLIDANRPVPELHTSAGRQTQSSQFRALKYGDGKDLQPIELYSLVNESHADWEWQSTAVSGDALGLYRKFNESGKQCLVYQLSSRGVFEEINGIVMAMVYARMNGLQLVLNMEAFRSSQGLRWDELFESFCPLETDIQPGRVIKRVSFDADGSLAEWVDCKPDSMNFGPTRLSGFGEIQRFFHSLIVRPTQGCLNRIEPLLSGLPEHEEFDVLLFQRGDIGRRHVSLIDCMRVLGPIPSQRILVLITDEGRIENTLRARLETFSSGARLLTLLPSRVLQELDTSIFEIMQVRVALKARYFVSNRVDATGRAASLMHLNRQWCHILTPDWRKRLNSSAVASRPEKFMVEVQLQDGSLHRLELPSDSPLIRQLKLLALVDGTMGEAGPANFIQLPVDGGKKALAFSRTALSCLRIIPAR